MSRGLRGGLVVVLLLGGVGCRARRELFIETVPEGAQVRLDDDLVGVTPLQVSFEHYGVRQATFYREGYRPKSQLIELKRPWWATFPLDLVTEILLPFGWRDRTSVLVKLEPELGEVSEQETREVLRRAEALRRAGPDGPRPLPADEPLLPDEPVEAAPPAAEPEPPKPGA